jgi:hypothetical protein
MPATREEILADILRSGFPLEIYAGSKFSEAGWNVRHQAIFRDNDERAAKYIDLGASKLTIRNFGRFDRLNITVVCECKKSEKPWVFYTPPSTELTEGGDMVPLTYLKLVSVPQFEGGDYPLLQRTHYISKEPVDRLGQANYMSFAGDRKAESEQPAEKNTGVRKPGGGYNQINPAINQVLKATRFQMGYLQPLLTRVAPTLRPPIRVLTIFYPLIVLDGAMWEYNLGTDSQPNLQEASYVKYQASVLGESRAQEATQEGEVAPQLFIVDVIRKERLSDYIAWLEEEIGLITNMPRPS